MPAASGCAHFPSLNPPDRTRRLLQSSLKEPDAAKESGGTFKTQAEDGQCPQSQLSDHSSGTRAYPRLLLPFLPGEAVQFVSRELTIYQMRKGRGMSPNQ